MNSDIQLVLDLLQASQINLRNFHTTNDAIFLKIATAQLDEAVYALEDMKEESKIWLN